MKALPLVAAILLSGCVSTPTSQSSPPSETAPVVALVTPTFASLGPISRTALPELHQTLWAIPEPSIAVGPDGVIYVSAVGCDRVTPFILVYAPKAFQCQVVPVYRSLDEGKTWTRLNRDPDGRLADQGPAEANNDGDVAVGPDGAVYVTALGAEEQNTMTVFRPDGSTDQAVPTWKSIDQGKSWTYLGDHLPRGQGADRPWIVAGAAGHLIHQWRGGGQIHAHASFDGGATWSNISSFARGHYWHGSVVMDATDANAFVPYHSRAAAAPAATDNQPSRFTIGLARSRDGGLTWQEQATGIEFNRVERGGGVPEAPTVAVTGDGALVLAWTHETAAGGAILFATSRDGGASWSEPRAVSNRKAAEHPWLVGGPSSRFAVAYVATDGLPGLASKGEWDLEVAIVDAPAAAEVSVVRAVAAPGVVFGGPCRIGPCLSPVEDPFIANFFEAARMPDGRIVVAYPSTPNREAKYQELRLALQTDGTLL